MSKLIKILGSIIGLSLMYLWISSTFQSCQNKKDNSDNIELVNETLDDGEELLEEVDEDMFDDDEDLSGDADDDEFVEFEDEPFEDDDETSSSSTTTNNSYTQSSSTTGKYLLISGNYLVESNAKAMQNKLKNMGFGSAEIVVFNQSSYHTVIASRYSNYNTALDASSNLKQKGIDCYIKSKS